ISDDESRLAWAGPGPEVTLWDAGGRRAPRRLDGHPAAVLAVALGANPGAPLLASADAKGQIRLWDTGRNGPPAHILTGHNGPVLDVELADGGQALVSAGADGTVRFWDATSGTFLRTADAHRTSVLSLAATPDGRRIVSGGGDGRVIVWDVRTGR